VSRYSWCGGGDAIQRFVKGLTFDAYRENELASSAVERQFKRIVAFRNVLIHGSAGADDGIVRGIVEGKLPALRVVKEPALHVALALVALVACKGPPARLVVGFADTVVVNHLGPVQVPAQVRDAAGHALPDTGIRFQWQDGVAVPVSPRGVVTCTHPGDAALRVSLGPLSTSVLLRCRPVHAVYGGGVVNLVLDGPPFDLSFQAVDSAGRPVNPLNARVSVADTTILARQGWRIRACAPGASGVDVSIGERSVHWSVFVYEPALTFADIRPGQLRAVPVRLAAGERRSWLLPPSPKPYWVQLLAERDTLRLPRLTISGANCIDQGPLGYECLARHGASVIASHPRQVDPAGEWSGTITVLRRDRP
jgi:hypothetical protein